MRKLIISILLAITISSFSSCITSLHQLVTYDKVITDNRITGNWQQEDYSTFTIEEVVKSEFFKGVNKATIGKEETMMGFDSKEDSMLYTKSYLFSFTKSGYVYYMLGSLMHLNNELYVDIFPIASGNTSTAKANETKDLFNNMPYIPSHTIAKITFNNSSMEIKFLNGDFIKTQLSKGTISVKYESDTLFNTGIVTASSTELQQFIIKYGDDIRLYNAENTITLKKI